MVTRIHRTTNSKGVPSRFVTHSIAGLIHIITLIANIASHFTHNALTLINFCAGLINFAPTLINKATPLMKFARLLTAKARALTHMAQKLTHKSRPLTHKINL